MLDDTFLNDLAKWYQKKFSNSTDKPSTYTQLISQFKTRSNSIDLLDPISTGGYSGGNVDLNDGAAGQDAKDTEPDKKPSKPKGGTTTTKPKGKTTTNKDPKPNLTKPVQTSKMRCLKLKPQVAFLLILLAFKRHQGADPVQADIP